jgi:5'-deoxynucleotidase YfbR-like HD superfamily hydrolase
MNKYGYLGFIKRTRRLATIERCSNTPHINHYSVAQHSFFISLYTKIFADLENYRYNKIKEKGKIDTLKAIEMAMMHDLEECITGDLLYPFKHGVDLDDVMRKQLSVTMNHVVETHVDKELFKELPNNIKEVYIRLWRGSKNNGIEGVLVEAMDKFEILIFALGEMEMGNMQMKPIYKTAMKILLSKYSMFKSLMDVILSIHTYYRDTFINDCCRKEENNELNKMINTLENNLKL